MTDYYTHIANSSYSTLTGLSSYGFQGQEKDDEVNRNDALDGVEDKGVNLENNDVIFLDKPIDITDDSEREVTEEDKTGTIHVDFGVYE